MSVSEADPEIVSEYRRRFPKETQPLSDLQLTSIVMETEDDMADDEWKTLFKQKAHPKMGGHP